MVFHNDGISSLLEINLETGGRRVVANDLDADSGDGGLALAPDGRSVYLPLASDGLPDNESRHRPNAARWLKIYRLDLGSGARQRIVNATNEDTYAPMISSGYLYWTRNAIHNAVALVSPNDGTVREIIQNAQVPMWSPDGRRLSYVIGGWRRADWALNLDSAAVRVNVRGELQSQPVIVVEGYHEDFPAAWSPNGRWIAYHSHRSPTPVVEYEAPGSSDDIYLRRADDLHAQEIRLTDFGWETSEAHWSPNGRQLLFTSWVRGGQPGIDRLWVLTLDPRSGQVRSSVRLPLPSEIRSVGSAAWSPNGTEIAVEDRAEGDKRSLWALSADGTRGRKLLDYRGTTYEGLDWMPNAQTIVYSGLTGNSLQLFAASRDGSNRQISHDMGNLLHPQVSPDGRWIACTRLVQSRQIWRRPLPPS